MSFWFIIQIIILLICIALMVIALYEFFGNLSRNRIGLVPTVSPKINQALLKIVDKYYSKKETETLKFVELGSGLGNMSLWAEKDHRFKEVIAVEVDLVWYNLSKLLAFLNKQKITFIRKNIFNYQSPKNSLIYCYLGNTINTKLYQEKLLDGNLVISTTFCIDGLKPTEKIETGGFYGQIYVYDFRHKA